jgi:quercetin dioxygenase-like cupin family protein
VANAGDTIDNPLTGERITFLQTTRDTDGELLRFEYLIPPGFSIPEHVHPRQEERHEVLSGALMGRVGGREETFVQGQRVIGPAGVPHAWRNPSDAEGLVMVSELRPALGFENLIVAAFAVAGDLKADWMGVPKHLLRLSILLDGSRDDFYPTRIPVPAWKAVLVLNAALARAGRSLGYDDGRTAVGRPVRAGLLAAGTLAALVFARRRGRGRRATVRR